MTDKRVLAACAALLICLAGPAVAFGQTPGAPRVTVLADNSLVLTYSAPATPPSGTVLAVTFNGIPLGNIPIGTNTTIASNGPVPPGAYTVQVNWGGGRVSDVVGVNVGVGPGTTPATTTLHPPVVNGNTVFLSWDPIPGVTTYEVEAIIFNTGQRLLFPVNQTSLTVQDVPLGNYGVRVRGRTSIGYGGFSNQVLVNVSTPFRLRDLEVTLTWNTQTDVDLHIIEPNGTHVWWRTRNGTTVILDRDNTTGFGPETASILIGGALPGIYQIFVVHYRGDAPTTSTIAVTLGVGTANPETKVFTRYTAGPSATVGYNVALVDVKSGVIGEQFGTRLTQAADQALVEKDK